MKINKLIANIIYGVYLLVVGVVIFIAAQQVDDESSIALIISFVVGSFFFILITMHMTYWLMPKDIRVHWHDNPPKKDSNNT